MASISSRASQSDDSCAAKHQPRQRTEHVFRSGDRVVTSRRPTVATSQRVINCAKGRTVFWFDDRRLGEKTPTVVHSGEVIFVHDDRLRLARRNQKSRGFFDEFLMRPQITAELDSWSGSRVIGRRMR